MPIENGDDMPESDEVSAERPAVGAQNENSDKIDFSVLRAQMDSLRHYIASIEMEAKAARQDAHNAHEEITRLRDQVASAQRDQQELKKARAKLARNSLSNMIDRLLRR